MRSTILTIMPNPSERQPRALPPAPSIRGEAVAATTALPSIESVILQKLLTELETRQLNRTQPTYVIEQAPASRYTNFVRWLCGAVWALSMIVCVFVVKYIDSKTMTPRTDASQAQAIEQLAANAGEQRREFATMVDSLQGLAAVIALSSKRTAVIPDMLNRLGSDLERIPSPAARQAVELTPTPGLASGEVDSGPISMGGHHHPLLESAILAPPDVVVHHNAAGAMDYWLVPRMVGGVRTAAKVVPISQSTAGTFVHDVTEVKDYIVTPTGVWIAASELGESQ